MSDKLLTHERVQPVDPTNSLRLIALAKNESFEHPRHYFINRKQDRFTLSARYAETGLTPRGKKWVRWRTLLSFSITYRQPANSNFPNLNLFYIGSLYGKKIQGVINVTRNPAIVLEFLPIALLNIIYDDLVSLIKRNNTFVSAEAIERIPTSEVQEELNKLIQDIAYPLFRGTNIEKLTKNPPAFLTSLFRSRSIQDVCKYFKVDIKSNLGSYLEDKFRTLSPASLFALEASQGILFSEDRLELVKIHEARGKTEVSRLDDHFSYWEKVGSEIPALRSIFRRSNHEDVFSMLSSEYKNMLSLDDSLKAWRANSKILSHSSFKNHLTPISTFQTLSTVISEEISLRKKETPPVSVEAIENQIKELCSDKFLPWKADKEWSSDSVTAHLGSCRAGALNTKPKTRGFNQLVKNHGMYAIHNPMTMPMDKKSVIWNLLKASNFASLSLATEASPLFLTQKTFSEKDNILLLPAAYSDFLKRLKEQAVSDLIKYKMEVSQENISFYIAALFIFTKFYQLKKYNGIIPRKFFTLVKAGVAPDMALLFLKKNISVKTATELKDVPEKWVYKALGMNEESSDLF